MIELSPTAAAHLEGLRQYYVEEQRVAALRYLIEAVDTAKVEIAANPTKGLPAPPAYPDLARHGFLWRRVHIYWIAFEPTDPPIIAGIFWNQAEIPNWF